MTLVQQQPLHMRHTLSGSGLLGDRDLAADQDTDHLLK
jgi:hypothetical protein